VYVTWAKTISKFPSGSGGLPRGSLYSDLADALCSYPNQIVMEFYRKSLVACKFDVKSQEKIATDSALKKLLH